MKLHADRPSGPNAITRHGPGGVVVGGIEYRSSIVVPWAGSVSAWPVERFDALREADFELLRSLEPELVIFGSGVRLRFPRPEWLRPLIDARIGVETMDTAAACRTYNVLFGEGRAVVAALLFETAAAASS